MGRQELGLWAEGRLGLWACAQAGAVGRLGLVACVQAGLWAGVF